MANRYWEHQVAILEKQLATQRAYLENKDRVIRGLNDLLDTSKTLCRTYRTYLENLRDTTPHTWLKDEINVIIGESDSEGVDPLGDRA